MSKKTVEITAMNDCEMDKSTIFILGGEVNALNVTIVLPVIVELI